MSGKPFEDCDVWEESKSNDNLKQSSFSFKKNLKNKTKTKKAKKRNHSSMEEDVEAGKYVRAPNYEPLDSLIQDTPPNQKKDKKKRKYEAVDKSNQSSDGVTPEKKKKIIEKHLESQKTSNNKANGENVKTFQNKLRENLKGSRFRFLNEQMYKQTGSESMKTFQEDSTAFEAYHEGFRHQISQWPMNPLDRIIKNIKKLPKNHVIVDMGCGDARLSQSVLQKVYSIDLVSNIEGVIESDMAKTPLESNSTHVVVYCLSLMGTNLKDFFIEANRILKLNGIIKIAEVSSRFDNIDTFIQFVQKCGFELVSKDLTHNLFYFLNFKKTHDVNNFNKKIPDYQLKPCLYKKR